MRAKDLLSSKPVPVLPIMIDFCRSYMREMEKIKFDCQLSKHFIQFKSNKDLSMYVLMLRFCNTNTCKDADNFLSFASIEMATIFGRCCEGYDKSKSIYN